MGWVLETWVGNQLVLDKFTSWEGTKNNIPLVGVIIGPALEKNPVCWTGAHPSAESIFAHSKLAGIKCTYLF